MTYLYYSCTRHITHRYIRNSSYQYCVCSSPGPV